MKPGKNVRKIQADIFGTGKSERTRERNSQYSGKNLGSEGEAILRKKSRHILRKIFEKNVRKKEGQQPQKEQ